VCPRVFVRFDDLDGIGVAAVSHIVLYSMTSWGIIVLVFPSVRGVSGVLLFFRVRTG
jgi:hypothetical protein